eukprot:Pgem_evm1s18554
MKKLKPKKSLKSFFLAEDNINDNAINNNLIGGINKNVIKQSKKKIRLQNGVNKSKGQQTENKF